MKLKTSVMLSAAALQKLAQIAAAMGVSKSAALEVIIRQWKEK